MFGLVTSKLVILGLVILGLVMFGFVMLGLVMSGLRTAEELRPLVTTEPPMALICATFTVTRA